MPDALLIVCALVSALAVDTPRVEPIVERSASASTLYLAALPIAIIEDEVVHGQLTSGLTTSLMVRAKTVGRPLARIEGGARIDIRFEPWDEIFEVSMAGIDGRGERMTFDSMDALEAWWRTLRLPILTEPSLATASVGRVRVDLDVVPFSEQEQRDTQRWFTDVLDEAGAAREIGSSTGRGNDALRQVFHLLMATSIRRRPLVSFGWTVPWKTSSSEAPAVSQPEEVP